jgi:small subunit ribosomal protein S18
MSDNSEVRYLAPINIEITNDKFCRFKKYGIKHVDYKNPDFLLKFVNEQGKLLPRRLTGTSAKYQKKVAQAVKRARHLAILPYLADQLK